MKPKLDVGSTLGEVFSTYGARAGVLLPLAFWLFLIVAIVNGLIGGNLVLEPIGLAVTTVVGTLYQGMVVGLLRDLKGGREPSVVELMRSAAPVILPLIGAGLLSGLAIGIGFVLFIIPGLILLTIWAVIAPAIVIERKGVMAAFGRSRELVRGNGWSVFGVIIVAFLIAFFAGLVLTAIAAAIANGPLIRIVFSAIAGTFTAPIGALVAAVLFFRLRRIEEASANPGTDPSKAPPRQGPGAM
jgi:hypothetical protein